MFRYYCFNVNHLGSISSLSYLSCTLRFNSNVIIHFIFRSHLLKHNYAILLHRIESNANLKINVLAMMKTNEFRFKLPFHRSRYRKTMVLLIFDIFVITKEACMMEFRFIQKQQGWIKMTTIKKNDNNMFREWF